MEALGVGDLSWDGLYKRFIGIVHQRYGKNETLSTFQLEIIQSYYENVM